MEILWLGHPDCHDINLAGAKAANLSRLTACYQIPPGFCVTTEAYPRWVEQNGAGKPPCPTQGMPPALYNDLAAAYQNLAERCGVSDPSVAVRSSGVDEDSAAASFAGQHETYLNIVGVDAVAEAVTRCWASASSEHALAYRQQQGQPGRSVRLAVLVQQLVLADVSAVVFSANPVNGNREEIVINASWGLGESVVGGTVTPDAYVVRKSDLGLVSREIAEKRLMTVLVDGGTQGVPVPRERQKAPVLDEEQVGDLAGLSMMLESEMGWPVDIECAFQGQELYLLQCRPITTLGVI